MLFSSLSIRLLRMHSNYVAVESSISRILFSHRSQESRCVHCCAHGKVGTVDRQVPQGHAKPDAVTDIWLLSLNRHIRIREHGLKSQY